MSQRLKQAQKKLKNLKVESLKMFRSNTQAHKNIHLKISALSLQKGNALQL